MRIQSISYNFTFESKKKLKTNKIEELLKLGAVLSPGAGVIIPQNATPETIQKIENIIKKDFPDFKVCSTLTGMIK